MGLWNSTPQDESLDTEWRTVNWSDREPMLKTLRAFQSNQSVDHLRILVVGPEGAGKSAFITSVNNILQGRNTCLSHSLTDGSSDTCEYTIYKLNKSTDGSFFPFVFGDTMGLKEGYTVNPDKFHCLVFVLPADNIGKISEEIVKKMKEILQKANTLGIPQVVVMSKVDAATSLVKENLRMIYRSKIIKENVEKCKDRLGIPVNRIFPVKNYHEEITTNTEADILILMAVTNIVNFANDFVKASGKPWRPVNWSDREPMLKTLREFQSNRSVEYLRILVVGPAGAGKSAFITSVNSALQGRNTYLAHSLTGGLSVTHKYTSYKLNKSTEESFFPFVICDTMGLEGDQHGIHTNDIISILQGHMQEGYTFNPKEELTAESNYFNKTPNLNDTVHCLVFVLPADTIAQIPEKIMDKMKKILNKARELGIPLVVIVSKVDAACPTVKENLTMIYRSKKIKEGMEECNVRLGIPVNCIFPVKNYHEEITNNAEADILILMALTNIVNFANDFVKRKLQK